MRSQGSRYHPSRNGLVTWCYQYFCVTWYWWQRTNTVTFIKINLLSFSEHFVVKFFQVWLGKSLLIFYLCGRLDLSCLLIDNSAGNRLHQGKRVVLYLRSVMYESPPSLSRAFTVWTPLSACPLLCGYSGLLVKWQKF